MASTLVKDTKDNLVKSKERFWSVLKRIHETNDGVVYQNEERSFKFMIRNDPDGGAGKFMVFDLAIIATEDDDRVQEALEMEHDGWWDDDDSTMFVIESWEFEKAGPDDEELQEMMDYVNCTYDYKICPCGTYFIKDKKDACFYCEMTASDEDMKRETCPICLSDGFTMHMKKTKCCDQIVHRGCAKAWTLKGKSGTCALCRAPTQASPPRVGRDRIVLQIDENAIQDIVNRIGREMAAENDDSNTNDTESADDE
jgi:hypothetical protein